MPKRVQRKRTKGWKMPKNCKYVGRPTKWGNPMKIFKDSIYIDAGYRRKILNKWVFLQVGDLDDMLHLYWHIVNGTQFMNKDLQYWSDKFKKLNLNELRGFDLSCFCPLSSICHADVLLELANK